MNWSPGALTAEVPLGVVTVTSTVPVPAGAVTVRLVAVTPVIAVPAVEPKSTAVAPVKLVPRDRDRGPAARGPVGRADAGDRRRRAAATEQVGHEMVVVDSTELTSW